MICREDTFGFCDGYYEQSYNVTKKFLFVKIKSWKEYDDRLYMNWGWGPNFGNGWYTLEDHQWEALDGKYNHYHKHIRMYVNLKDYRIPFNDNWMFDDLEDLDDDIL